jgi:hypothetical protein
VVAYNHLSTHVPKLAPSTAKIVPFLWSFSNFYEIFIIIQLLNSYIAENRQRKMVVNTDKSCEEALIWVTRVVEELVGKIRQLREDGAVGPTL